MLISEAMAATADAAANAPSAWEAFALNMLLILILVIMFYVLLIMPQQKRMKQHRAMLSDIQKGDKVIIAGGFIGTIDKISNDNDEAVIDMGGSKMTVLRSAIQNKREG